MKKLIISIAAIFLIGCKTTNVKYIEVLEVEYKGILGTIKTYYMITPEDDTLGLKTYITKNGVTTIDYMKR